MNNTPDWLKVECAKCGSWVGEKCQRPTTLDKDGAMFVLYDNVYVSHPHIARVTAGKKAQGKRNNRRGSRHVT